MNLFTKYFKKSSPEEKLVFIVEDNEVYATSLKDFLMESFPNRIKVKTYSIGEMCLLDMERKPLIVIMDYFLNSKYEKAINGLEIIKRIKMMKPATNIIVLSVQKDIDVVSEAIRECNCRYVQKDQEAFKTVKRFVKEIFNNEDPLTLNILN